MKTTVNVNADMHRQVCDLAPDVSFSELVRDALIIAHPQWAREAKQGSQVLTLHVKLRAARFSAVQVAAAAKAPAPGKRQGSRRASGATPAPASPPARRSAAGKRSKTTAG